jgi:hypothetical protein
LRQRKRHGEAPVPVPVPVPVLTGRQAGPKPGAPFEDYLGPTQIRS